MNIGWFQVTPQLQKFPIMVHFMPHRSISIVIDVFYVVLLSNCVVILSNPNRYIG